MSTTPDKVAGANFAMSTTPDKVTGAKMEAECGKSPSIVPPYFDGDNDEDDNEKRHFIKVVASFKHYKEDVMARIDQSAEYFNKMSFAHQKYLPHFPDNVERLKKCCEANNRLLEAILEDVDVIFTNKLPYSLENGDLAHPVSRHNMDKVKTTLKQFVRDWSSDGQEERDSCYQPIIDELLTYFPASKYEISDISVLVPGAGLGRLAFDIARLGYTCQGNEFSLYMLFASNFILNKSTGLQSISLYPWICQWNNNWTFESQVRPVRIPDICPFDVYRGKGQFSMAAGDFLEVYREANFWDAIASSFFLDTAHNIIVFLERMFLILKPGGVLINLGPLLYHYSDMPGEESIELPWEDVISIVHQIGFKILKEDRDCHCTYIRDSDSMLKYNYHCGMFVAMKPEAC